MASARFLESLRLLNEGFYFAAHHVLEELWRRARDGGDEARADLYQGLLHAAVALHHRENGNEAGARAQAAKAQERLLGLPERFEGIDLVKWMRELSARLEGRGEAPRIPLPEE